MTALEIVKNIIAVIATFTVGLVLFLIKTLFEQLKTLKKDSIDQQVKNEVKNVEFDIYVKYRDKLDNDFKKGIEDLGKKIENLRETISTEIGGVKDELNQLKIELAQNNNTS